MPKFVFLLFFLFTPLSQANEPMDRFVSGWNASCPLVSGLIQVEFKSISGDSTNDDMRIHVRSKGRSDSPVAISPALFVPGKLKSTFESACDQITGAELPGGHLLLLIKEDDRPLDDRVVAALIDSASGAALDVVPDLGSLLQDSELAREGDSLRMRLNRSRPGTLRISEVNDKLKVEWQ